MNLRGSIDGDVGIGGIFVDAVVVVVAVVDAVVVVVDDVVVVDAVVGGRG